VNAAACGTPEQGRAARASQEASEAEVTHN